jgi:hypothetical protein
METLENRANSEVGVNIIKSCLEQINSYVNFQKSEKNIYKVYKK